MTQVIKVKANIASLSASQVTLLEQVRQNYKDMEEGYEAISTHINESVSITDQNKIDSDQARMNTEQFRDESFQIRNEVETIYENIGLMTQQTTLVAVGGETQIPLNYNPNGLPVVTLNGFVIELTEDYQMKPEGDAILLEQPALEGEEYQVIVYSGFESSGSPGSLNGNTIYNELVSTFGSISNIITAEQGNSDVWLEGGGGVSNSLPSVFGPVSLTSMDENTTRLITLTQLLYNSSDPDGDTLSVINLTATSGTLEPSGNDWNYTPDQDFTGQVTFNYLVSDGIGSTPATATITVDEVSGPIYGPTIDIENIEVL